MPDRVPPICRLFFPCDEAVFDLDAEVWRLTNPWHTVWMPAGRATGHIQEDFWLYAQLTDGVGEHNFAVEMRSYPTNFVLGRSDPEPRALSTEDRLAALEVVFRFREAPFPSPEVYVFELFANGRPIEGGVSYLRVLPG